jgi:hypothetical protein
MEPPPQDNEKKDKSEIIWIMEGAHLEIAKVGKVCIHIDKPPCCATQTHHIPPRSYACDYFEFKYIKYS